MATALARPISFPDIGINEQDQDPNSALLELDRALKSNSVGEQCEAISRFPALFEKYPFPILINSALLKLAEVFHQEIPGSNFVRVCVSEVVESSGRHLDKLINVDEFLRRITTVMHSNDPLARALTLRTLSWMCGVVGENRQVHHLVRNALDANHPLELQAAINAAEKYAAVSKTFAVNMCERLTQMLSGLATPVDIKLQLIQVFQHMHHDAETAATVRGVCLKLLEQYPTQRVVITTLHTLTQLASHCLVDIPQQVELLMQCLQQEARVGVRQAVLLELSYLAGAAPHAWSCGNVDALVMFIRSTRHNAAATAMALSVLAKLTSAPALHHLRLTPKCELLSLCTECIQDINLTVACKALQVYTNIALYMSEEDQNMAVCEDAYTAAVNLLLCVVATSGISKPSSTAATTEPDAAQTSKTADASAAAKPSLCDAVPPGLRVCLLCCVLLAREDSKLSSSLAHNLVLILTDNSLSVTGSILVCEALAAIGGSHSDVIVPHVTSLIQLIKKQMEVAGAASQHQKRLMCALVTVVLQLHHGHQLGETAKNTVTAVTKSVGHWSSYRVARQASRYGHHSLAAGLYSSLSCQVCSDQQYFWMSALTQLSRGEAYTVGPGERSLCLTKGNTHLLKALAGLKAASTSSQTLVFCQEYVKLRAENLMAHAQLLHACQSLRTAPPPAIAASLAASSRDELLRCGRVTHQLVKSAREFTTVAAQYGTLYQSVFDADPQTLCNLSLLQQGCLMMARAIEVLTRPSSGQVAEEQLDITSIMEKLTEAGHKSIQTPLLIQALTEANKLVLKLIQVTADIKPIREHHLRLLMSMSAVMTTAPLPYPRLFFQSLQRTTITLNLTPQPRTPGDPITVQTSSQLAIKVEGVISHGKRPGLFRSVQSVILAVCSQLQSRPQHVVDMKAEPSESMTQTVKPHNDFFSAQFLLSFSIPGLYQVSVDASVRDNSDDVWQTGPRHTLSVKSLEDPTTKTVLPPARLIPPAQYPPPPPTGPPPAHPVPPYPIPRPPM